MVAAGFTKNDQLHVLELKEEAYAEEELKKIIELLNKILEQWPAEKRSAYVELGVSLDVLQALRQRYDALCEKQERSESKEADTKENDIISRKGESFVQSIIIPETKWEDC